jgi:hypothetical protein
MDTYEKLVMSTMLNDFHAKLTRNMDIPMIERDRQFKAYWRVLDRFNAECASSKP